jgi:bifunctional non-homologous end joining protein LigD
MKRKLKAKAKQVPRRLREYQRKRDFRKTPEPPPKPAPVHAVATFMVHKHDASRLHYDLRLEMGGALASWAIPKGPSYDPSVKRLAVQTEDHPLEYGQFEGRIPDGEYGAGDSLIWDRGSYETIPPGQGEAQRQKGHLHIQLNGDKLRGRWHLVRTRGAAGKPQWLFFKAKDEAADASFDVVASRPESVVSGRRVTRGPERAKVLRAVHPLPEKLLERVFPPMLATLIDEAPADESAFLCENKYDGFRALCALSGGRVAMWSRNQLDLAGRFPAIAKALSRLVVGEAVIDGEAVALDREGVSRFEALQQGGESMLYAFDLLWLNGEDLRQRPLEERRELLESLLSNVAAPLALAERLDGGPEKALAKIARQGGEGIVIKRRGSVYEPKRSRNWLKLKAQNTSELAIVGYTPATNSDQMVGALLLAVNDHGKLRFAGKVGTGFSTKQRRELKRELSAAAVDEPPLKAPRMRDAIWVEPRLVAQVRFTEWTQDGKLRHPSFQGLRPDKKPEEAVREIAAPQQKVTLTNPDKVLYPESGYTKTDVLGYYQAMGGPLMTALKDRPIAFEQFHDGISKRGIFRQNVTHPQPWMHLVDTPTSTKKGTAKHLVPDSPEALAWLAQNNALTVHMWSSRDGHLGMPDWVVFDLDPADGESFAQVVPVAQALHRLFEEMSLPSLPKTSGKRGLHVLVPLAPGHTHEDAYKFAVRIGEGLASALPQITLERPKKERRGRLYFDCVQNGYGKTIIAPYSLRASAGAPVSTPLRWSEVTEKLIPAEFNLKTILERLDRVGDLFATFLSSGVRLPRIT